MNLMNIAKLLLVATVAFCAATASAQTSAQTPAPKAEGKPAPCWKQAGIDKSLMKKRKEFAEQAKTAVKTVCADSSLSVPDRRKKIRAIRQSTREQFEALISASQRDALKQCQQARRGQKPPHPKTDPCAQTGETSEE